MGIPRLNLDALRPQESLGQKMQGALSYKRMQQEEQLAEQARQENENKLNAFKAYQENQSKVAQIFAESNGDIKTALPRIRGLVDPETAMKWEQFADAREKNDVAKLKVLHDEDVRITGLRAQALGSVKDEASLGEAANFILENKLAPPELVNGILARAAMNGFDSVKPILQLYQDQDGKALDRAKQIEVERHAREQEKIEAAKAGKEKETDTTRAVDDWMAARGLEPNPANRDKARESIKKEVPQFNIVNRPEAPTGGSYVTLTNERGEVVGAWNPKTNETVKTPEGFAGARKSPLSEESRAKEVALDDMIWQAERIDVLAAKHRDSIGPVDSALGRVAAATVGNDPEVAELRRLTGNIGDQLLRARSGAAVTPSEYERLVKLVPQTGSPESNFVSNLKSFYDELKRIKQSRGMPSGQGAPAPAPAPAAGGSDEFSQFGGRAR